MDRTDRTRTEPTESDRKAAEDVMRHLNRGGRPDMVAAALASDHPTLQQLFMRVAVAFIKEVAAKPYVDLRNEASQKAARAAVAAWDAQDKGGPYLPLI
jgi:hypothetical protein